jgi:hypothetical protein
MSQIVPVYPTFVFCRQPKLTDFEFHPDVLPTQRQVFYMACDIYDPQVTDLLAKNDGKVR